MLGLRPGVGRQDQRNKTVLRRRTSIFTAALELKKLRAQGGALHYRVWDPQSGVDTSWPKKYTGPFDYVPGSGSCSRKPAPVPRFRWRQRADDEGLPYYVDSATGDTVRAAPVGLGRLHASKRRFTNRRRPARGLHLRNLMRSRAASTTTI